LCFRRTEAPDGLCANAIAVIATRRWAIYRWGWQFIGSEVLDQAYVLFFGAFGTRSGRGHGRALERQSPLSSDHGRCHHVAVTAE
jgi:hypothetical protein